MKVALITGCSSGIGKALSLELHQRGFRVVATARRVEALEEQRVRGLATYRLDVDDADERNHVIEDVLAREGKVDMLVNNAGYGLMGPVVDLPETELLAQFRTLVLSPLALIRNVVPSMREHGDGTIVNMGSISGVVTTPFSGAYCASKAALHAFSDALRMELAPFGIKVITVQAGAVRSGFGTTASSLASRLLKPDSWYQPLEGKIRARANISQVDATPTEEFTRRLVDALVRDDPPRLVRLGNKSRWLPLLRSLVPMRVLDRYLKRKFGLLTLAGQVLEE